jgi:hypothetical protein
MSDIPRVVAAVVQGCIMLAIAFVGGQLWSMNNEVREMKGDLKYVLGQTARIDRLEDATHELRRGNAARDSQLGEIVKRLDIHREVLLKLQKDVDRP